MLVDDIGDVTITNDGATILKLLEVQHPAAKVRAERLRGLTGEAATALEGRGSLTFDFWSPGLTRPPRRLAGLQPPRQYPSDSPHPRTM